MKYLDCYADWNREQITLGNARMEIRVSIAENLAMTLCVFDKTTGKRWEATDSRGVIQPTLTVRPAFARSEVAAEISDFEGRMAEHLRVSWTLTDGDGVWRTVWQIFPEIPFVRKSLFAAGPYRDGEPVGTPDTGVWSAHGQCSEALAFDRLNLTVDAVSLHDHNDSHDDLTRTTRYYPYIGGFHQLYPGSIFFMQLPRTACLTLCKLAPCTESQLYAPVYGLRTTHQGAAELVGLGIDRDHPLPAGELVELYGAAVGVGRSKADCEAGLRALGRACVRLPGRLLVTSNNWGAGNQFDGLNEAFVRREAECGGKLGLDNVQIDDGWQQNDFPDEQYMNHRWTNMFEEGLDFWAPHAERFPNGIGPLARYALDCGTTLGLWIMDDPYESHRDSGKTIEMILSYYRQGVRVFKLDGIQMENALDGCRLRDLFDRLHRETGGKLLVYADITADRRPGCLYMPQAGLCFLENRSLQKRVANYPHRTVGNLWRMGRYIPTQRLIMELPDPRKVSEGYPDDLLSPARYPITTLFLGVAVSNPLLWMELQNLDPADQEALTELIAVWKPYAAALHDSDVCPIGEDPEEFTVAGFHAKGDGEGHLFHVNYEGMSADIPVADLPDGTRLETLWADTEFTAGVRDGMLHFTAGTACRAVWLHYKI